MKAIVLALALLVVACSASVGNGDAAASDVVAVDEDVTQTDTAAGKYDAITEIVVPADVNDGDTVVDASSNTSGQDDVVEIDDAFEPGALMTRVVPLGTTRLVDGENLFSHIHLWASGRTVTVKKFTYDGFPMLPMGSDFRWLPRDLRVEFAGRALTGARTHIWEDVEGSSHALRVQVTFDRERRIDSRGVDIAVYGRPSMRPQPLEGFLFAFRIRPTPYFHGADVGALTPDGWAPSTSSDNLGPHIYNGGGFCENLITPLQPNAGNVSFGVILWSPNTAFNHNDFDCQHGGTPDWRNWADTTDPIRGGFSLEQWLISE